ncbi:lipopolysaccharide modification protein [Salmonella enterica subsp. arizonae]|uniref:Lipopolysaccharide modification protein n=1 Tax=Salmonella enterica subsp. arizonae TaxID=59203 RepID=A0A3S4GK14_SALER|nr:lipopolysaccharide modification protein [Salmonella enterica subsp. arizonae]
MFDAAPIKKVSVVIPVYNEQESLPELIRRTTAACESLGKAWEILLIDDGSSDSSAELMVKASQEPVAISSLFYSTVTTVNMQRLWRDLVM